MADFKHKLFFDTEVKAPYPGALKSLGLYTYAAHPRTRVVMMQYAIDDGPAQVIDLAMGQPPSAELKEAWQDPSVQIIAHNAMYDRVVMARTARAPAPIERWYCTRARAYAHGLPGELKLLSKIYGLGEESKKDGDRLIQLFCEQGADPREHMADWMLFLEYGSFDAVALRSLYHKLPGWSFTETEQRIWHLDQHINDRGFCVDLDLAEKLIEESQVAEASLHERIQRLTEGKVTKGTQRERVKDWLNDFGDPYAFGDMRAETLRKAIRDHRTGVKPLTETQLDMISIRLLSAKSSISKCKTALQQAGADNRVRGAITYGGGGRILRFSHKGFQPGNLPRPPAHHEDKELIAGAIELAMQDSLYTVWGDETLEIGASCLRGLIIAGPGKKLVAADWSNIEGRKLAWFAGEDWKLQAYRDQDSGAGADGYKLLGNQMTGKPIEDITKFERQQFKGCDLSMGYEGGIGAFLNIANSYQIDLVALGEQASQILSDEYMAQGRSSWEWAIKNHETHGLPEPVYVACAALRNSYRDACPNIRQSWEDLLTCAKAAVMSPGKALTCLAGKITMLCSTDKQWLSVRIPSGRQIMFARPAIKKVRKFITLEDGTKVEKPPKLQLTALKSPAWRRESIYGGLLANAITQGSCRDILAFGLLNADAQGFPTILHVHDEIIAELDDADPRDHEDLIEVMLQRPHWIGDMPLNADGFTTKRYRKD